MKASELRINKFLQAPYVQFVIPVYQRNYDWTAKECSRLLKDILTVIEEDRNSHFIGSIVFIHEGIHSTAEVKELVIIDGQQRLTTINILYAALYRFAKENNREQDRDKLYNLILTNQYVTQETSKLKLKQTDNNFTAFKAIILGNEKQFDTYSNVIENYQYFKSHITAQNFQTIIDGLDRLMFVEISLERDKDDPQRIFESLNATGLELSQSDLIRNFILMDLEPHEQNRTFQEIWNPIEENARDLKRQKSLVSAFIRDYLTLKNKKIPNKRKVYQEFKKRYPDKKDSNYAQELENIKSLSLHYRKFINPHTVQDHALREQLKQIATLEINVAYPFLLQVFEDADNGILQHQELIAILKLIQAYVWRRFVVGLPTNALNKIFMTLYGEVDTENYAESVAIALVKKKSSSRFPNNEEIKSALMDKDFYNTQAKNRNYMFQMLENYNNREYVDTTSEYITIEHIFPQNPDVLWETDLSPDNYFLFKEKHLNTISNLTLSGNNGALGNKSFAEKKEMNRSGKEQGYRYSRLWLNDYLKAIDRWDLPQYQERFDRIYQHFLNIWQYPVVTVEETASFAETSIFNAKEPTGKKLEYFIFQNTKYETPHIAQMYFTVISELFKKNAPLLIENTGTVRVSKNPDAFRAAQELVNSYYTEANYSSEMKFKNLKQLLTLFGLEEELLIKYSDESALGSDSRTGKRFKVRQEYWSQLLPQLRNTTLFQNVSPAKDHWLGCGAGLSGVSYTMVITGKYCKLELTLLTALKAKNKQYYHQLLQHKKEIEAVFGQPLVWEELPDNKMSRVKVNLDDINLFDKVDWPKINAFFINTLPVFQEALQPFIYQLNQ